MANVDIDKLFPALIAGFDRFDSGQYSLPFNVSRNFESLVANEGSKVTVPLAPSFSAISWTPGAVATAATITQLTTDITLNKSYAWRGVLTDKELSLTPLALQEVYTIPALESILAVVNADILSAMGAATLATISVATTGITAANVRSAKKVLDSAKAGDDGSRVVCFNTDWANDLLGSEEFKSLTGLGTPEQLSKGILAQRYGFNFIANHAAATNAGYAFHPSGVALAARVYETPPAAMGVISEVVQYKGIPIRMTAMYSNTRAWDIQFDILYGTSVIATTRIAKFTMS